MKEEGKKLLLKILHINLVIFAHLDNNRRLKMVKNIPKNALNIVKFISQM